MADVPSLVSLQNFDEGDLTSPFTNLGPHIADTTPATPASQVERFSQIIGSAVQGTVAVVQSIKAPSGFYTPVKAGSSPGAASGAAQTSVLAAMGSSKIWEYVLIGGVALLGIGVALRFRK